jgi:hypothetical protein
VWISSQTLAMTHYMFQMANDLVQDKSIERNIECIDFKGFDNIIFEGSIRTLKGGLNTFYLCVRVLKSNLIWAMRWGENTIKKN